MKRLAGAFALLVLSYAAQAEPLKTGVDGTFAPHAMPTLSGGVEGFNIDLANEIGDRTRRGIVIESTQFSGLLPGLQAGSYDFIAAPTTVTPERAENLLFTGQRVLPGVLSAEGFSFDHPTLEVALRALLG